MSISIRTQIGMLCSFVAAANPPYPINSSGAPIRPSFFGMHVMVPRGGSWPTISFGAVGKGPGVNWAYLEPEPGVFNWYGLDELVANAESHGSDVFYALGSTPQWASSRPKEHCYRGYIGCAAPPTRIEYWNDYVTAVVTRYKGRIRFYELWDEANASPSWSGTYSELVQLAANAYSRIKSVDPKALVLTPATVGGLAYQPRDSPVSGVDGIWIEQYLKAGGNRYADAFNWHGYLMQPADSPLRMPESDSPCHIDSWNYQKACSGSILTQIDAIRAILVRNGMGEKPLINSEGSWGKADRLDPQIASAWLARYYLLQAGRGISRVYWYGWNFGQWGSLTDADGQPSLAGVAYTQIYRWLVGAAMSGPCISGRNGTTWACSMTRPGGYEALAIWDTRAEVAYWPDPQYKRYTDLFGGSHQIDGPVLIGPKPVLLENGKPPARPGQRRLPRERD